MTDLPWQEAACAGLLGLGLTIAGMPVYLGWARNHGWGQVIRTEGPQEHRLKAGTPTMGGLLLLTAGLVAGLWWREPSWDLLVFRLVVLLGAGLGMVDDLNKVLKRRNLGLRARDKLFDQGLLGLGLGGWLVLTRPEPGLSVPLVGFVAGSWLVWLAALLVMTSTMNAVNLTDGLDGLAGGTSAVALLAFGAVAATSGHPDLAVAAVGLAGACLGFLWFNCFPARVFMGDTGSLGLGAALAALALLTGTEFLLVLVGGVFVAEAASVILQVAWFKSTGGRRILRMSPLHHHFELGGLHEVQVTVRFILAGVILAVAGLLVHLGGLR
jgi:phospho-N-acetylmuramoyl-pentapeptide-transferase